jgi:DNA-binding beta-propeller fold protein YncE
MIKNRPLPALTIVGGLAAALVLSAAIPASATLVPAPIQYSADGALLSLTPVGSFDSGVFDASAAEIVAFHAGSDRLFVVNADQGLIQVLDISNPAAPVAEDFELVPSRAAVPASAVSIPGDAVANSVAVRADGLVAVAVENATKTDNGWVAFFDANASTGIPIGAVQVGALPDMLTFSPDGRTLLVANEAEPGQDYTVDPEGSVSVIDVAATRTAPLQSAVGTANFHAFETGGTLPLPADVRIFGGREDAGQGVPAFPVSENLEPEYITVSPDGRTAYVALQEANAMAVLNVSTKTITEIRSLGFKDYRTVALDASDRDGGIDITTATVPLFGMYQPDAIASYATGGQQFVVSANEGDSREWDGYSEVARVKDLGDAPLMPLCAAQFPAGTDADVQLGRLNISTASGLNAAGTCYEELYSYGARSFSIWNAAGAQVFDSGSALEELTAAAVPAFFNSNHSATAFDSRSDDKGPEPEGLALGEIDGRHYAFIGLERIGGIAVFDITAPTASKFVTYVNNRNFAVDMDAAGAVLADAGDLGPEGVTFISASDSPTGAPMLAVGNEVSGTTTLMSIAVSAAALVPGTGTDTEEAGAAPVEMLAATGAENGLILGALAAAMLAVGLLARRFGGVRA